MILVQADEKLYRAALNAAAHAYAPYSKFKVGAAIQCVGLGSSVYTGVNVENLVYGLTICAERGAIQTAIANGFKQYHAIAVATQRSRDLSPCGACRQVLVEFNPDMRVIFMWKGKLIVKSAEQLLPMPALVNSTDLPFVHDE